MSETDDDSKEELFQEFLEESEEMITEMEQFSISLESNPEDMEAIHGIFRCAHSIKGNSAFFGLTQVQTFCHQFESFLDLVRDRTIPVDRDLVHFILDGADFLKDITGRLRVEGMGVAIKEDEQAYFEQLQERTGAHSDESKMETLRGELISFFNKMKEDGQLDEGESPVKEVYDLINRYAPDMVREQKKRTDTGGVRWIYDTLDVTEEYADLLAVVEEAKEGEMVDNAFERIVNAVNGLLSKHLSSEIEEPVEGLQEFKDDFEMFYQDEIGIDEMMVISIEDALNLYAESGLEEVKPEKKPAVETKGEGAKGAPQTEGAVKTKTVRINESLLDDLIDHVGELITINELFNIIQRKMEQKQFEGLSVDLKNTNQAFGELSTQLQHVLYQIRKAPFERAYSKLPSIVRGIAKNSGKEISLSATGGDTEVDKSLLDKIETMLVHCIRNACDHGIEAPEERLEKGKPAEGKISVSAIAKDNQVFLTIEDDGRGADPDRISDKAVEKGLVSRETCGMMSEREILELMLMPGFSTAEQVTETSGRGVGMDVLLSSVKEMGGEPDAGQQTDRRSQDRHPPAACLHDPDQVGTDPSVGRFDFPCGCGAGKRVVPSPGRGCLHGRRKRRGAPPLGQHLSGHPPQSALRYHPSLPEHRRRDLSAGRIEGDLRLPGGRRIDRPAADRLQTIEPQNQRTLGFRRHLDSGRAEHGAHPLHRRCRSAVSPIGRFYG